MALTPPAPAVEGDAPERWSGERVASELAAYLGERAPWPSAGEMVADGRQDILIGLSRNGGPQAFRGALTPRQVFRLDDVYIEVALRSLIAERSRMPTRREMNVAGAAHLATRIVEEPQGHRRWARRLQATLVEDEQRWTEERILSETTEFLDGYEHWPMQSQFRAAGKARLMVAIHHHGGHPAWAARFGLPMRHRSGVRWT